MAYYLYKIWTKTNDGPWTQPSAYSPEEVDRIVNPHLRRMYSTLKGIQGQAMVYFESPDVFVRRYTFDTLENAVAAKKYMDDTSIPEVKALRELAKRYALRAGTTYKMSWRLTKI